MALQGHPRSFILVPI